MTCDDDLIALAVRWQTERGSFPGVRFWPLEKYNRGPVGPLLEKIERVDPAYLANRVLYL